MLKDGILSFMKDYPMLCVSEDLNEDDEYDDDDDDDYYYNESLYHSIEDVNTFNEQYTNTIDNTFNNETNNDINTIINTDNIELTQLNNTEINDIDMTSPSQNQDNDVTMENTIPSNDNNNNDVSISIENETMDNTENISNNKSDADEQVSNELEKTDKNKEIDNLEANTNSMDYQTNDDDDEINQNKKNIDIDDPNINNDNINNMVMDESTFTNNNDSEGLKESTTTESEGNIETETKVSDSMACYDPRQMASVNVDTTNNKLLTNNQTEEITKLRKFQRYLIHNVWYAMDNSNDVPLMVCPPFLYLGSLYTSQEHHLINYNIKHVIRLGTDFNITYTDPSRFNFYNFDIFDLPKEPIKELFQKANDIIENARLNHENVLVHCHAGVSRSSTIILAYLMRYKGMSLYDAWCSTFKIRPIIR